MPLYSAPLGWKNYLNQSSSKGVLMDVGHLKGKIHF
jgi:hypothetical protein